VKYTGKGEKLGDSLVLRVRDGRKHAVIGKQDDFLLVRSRPDLGSAQRAYRPRTWVILDDVSASRGVMELRAQQDLIDNFLRELDEEDKVAVVAFDVDARVKLAPTRVLDVDRQALRRALKDEGGVGATNFTAALGEATKLLANVAPDDAMFGVASAVMRSACSSGPDDSHRATQIEADERLDDRREIRSSKPRAAFVENGCAQR
jgi:vancomycin resistance protein YoaR